ncbi:hypothetical protein HDR70_05000 [bacterium]|nr:hypothetical protein [bacterium]MDE6255887.1 DUF308 domain-containing protein [Muribaculaceae bacterium]
MKSTFRGAVAKLWWFPLITGLLSIGLGIWCLCSPESSLTLLAYVFTAIMLLAGIMNITYAIINTAPHSGWGWSLALGLMEVILAFWLYSLPDATLVTAFIYGVGIYLVVIAINAICQSFMLYSHFGAITALLLVFLISTLVFAFIFLAGPIAGGIAVWLYIGISFITFGCYRIALAVKMKKINRRLGL